MPLPVAVGSIPACAGEPASPRPGGRCRGVYPRVCGGTVDLSRGSQYQSGLSPRVRGNRRGDAQSVKRQGSIPACAGEPHGIHASRFGHRVYPRVCGGTSRARFPRNNKEGLSPRVRGNRQEVLVSPEKAWSIPACAGEPDAAAVETTRRRVYPRVCGGTLPLPKLGRTGRGLSPRVRGNLRPRCCWPAPAGSIPACAGEPLLGPCPFLLRGVYPRVCGGTCFGRLGAI